VRERPEVVVEDEVRAIGSQARGSPQESGVRRAKAEAAGDGEKAHGLYVQDAVALVEMKVVSALTAAPPREITTPPSRQLAEQDMGHPGKPHRHAPPAVFRRQLLVEIRRRAKAGHPLNSGANRGDWVYAAAVRFFGSWGAAVEKAGFTYATIRLRDLDPEQVLGRICDLAAAGDLLVAGQHPLLRAAAVRHFGSWAAAVQAAGCELPDRRTWTREKVIDQIQDDLRRGLPVTTMAVLRRNEPLYGAGRREFGSWAATLAAVDPRLLPLRWRRSEPTAHRGRPRRPKVDPIP
jgi:hypothetical protein